MKAVTLPLVVALALAGCASEEPEPQTTGCSSTRECELGEVCHVLRGECVTETDQHVLGGFYCDRVFGTSISVADHAGVGSFSEVAGRVNLFDPKGGRTMYRLNAIAPPVCQVVAGVLYVQFWDIKIETEGNGTYIRLSADLATLRPGELVDTTEPTTYRVFAARGEYQKLKTDYMQSGDHRLQIWVEQLPVEGQPLRGFLDIDFEDVVPP